MYQSGSRLGAEKASKLGHLDVLQSENVQKLIRSFDIDTPIDSDPSETSWKDLPVNEQAPLNHIFSVDGSKADVSSSSYPRQEVSYVKTALFYSNERKLAELDPISPHPMQLIQIMKDSASFHATVFPLRNVHIPGEKIYNTIRYIIYDSFRDPSLDGLIYQTYKWLLYQEWDPKGKKDSPAFDCPHLNCGERIDGMPSGSDTWKCPHCGGELLCTDVLGFHQEMTEDSAPESLSTSYMLIHETLSLFSAIRIFWNGNRKMLSDSLFIKDGPLSLRAQYSKLVPSIRDFIAYAHSQNVDIYLVGQEKTGAFTDHLSTIARFAPPFIPENSAYYKNEKPSSISYFVLDHGYVRNEVQRIPDRLNEYGLKTNYGEKVYVKVDPYTSMVLSIPTTGFRKDEKFPDETELIGLKKILCTLPKLVSVKHEGALTPIVLANGIASLSSYPSASVLKKFAGLG